MPNMFENVKQSRFLKKGLASLAVIALATSLCAVSAIDTAYGAEETRTYTWANGESQPKIPQTIKGEDGTVMKLTSQSQPVQANGTKKITQLFTRSVDSTCKPSQLSSLSKTIPASVRINSDGFSGSIPRKSIDYTPVYHTEDQTITGTKTAYGSTPEEAKASLPATIYKQGRELSLTSSRVEEQSSFSDGTAKVYLATGEYSGVVTEQVLDRYNVVARYAGSLSKNVRNGEWSISAVYTSEDAPLANDEQEGDTEILDEDGDAADEPDATEEEIIEEEGTPDDELDDVLLDDPYALDSEPFDDGLDDDPYEDLAQPNYGNELDDEPGLPVMPIVLGAAIVALIAGIAGVVLSRRRKPAPDATDAAEGELVEESIVVPVLPIYPEEPQSQLVEVVTYEVEDEDGNIAYEFEQTPKAQLDIIPSINASIPTVIYFPSLVADDGERMTFEADEDASYWIAIDDETSAALPTRDVLIASAEGNEIYRGELIDEDGELTNQVVLDADAMIAAVNLAPAEGEELTDVSAELAEYEQRSQDVLDAVAQAEADAAAAAAEAQMIAEEQQLEADELALDAGEGEGEQPLLEEPIELDELGYVDDMGDLEDILDEPDEPIELPEGEAYVEEDIIEAPEGEALEGDDAGDETFEGEGELVLDMDALLDEPELGGEELFGQPSDLPEDADMDASAADSTADIADGIEDVSDDPEEEMLALDDEEIIFEDEPASLFDGIDAEPDVDGFDFGEPVEEAAVSDESAATEDEGAFDVDEQISDAAIDDGIVLDELDDLGDLEDILASDEDDDKN